MTFDRIVCVTFLKTSEPFGGLSNMAGGYPLRVNETPIRTSEALYQAMRFPKLPDVQRLIIAQASPMAAKMKGKPFRQQTRPDWDDVRIDVMRWCLQVKLAFHWETFGGLLRSTGSKVIVEVSHKDKFWGAVPTKEDPDTLDGDNNMGRLLTEARKLAGGSRPERVDPFPIPDFLLFGEAIRQIVV